MILEHVDIGLVETQKRMREQDRIESHKLTEELIKEHLEEMDEKRHFLEMVRKREDKLCEGCSRGELGINEYLEYKAIEKFLQLWGEGKISRNVFSGIKKAFYFPSRETNLQGNLHASHRQLSDILTDILKSVR